MKQIITLRNLVVASCLAAGSMVNTASAQIQPLAFGPYLLGTSTTPTNSNFYKDYVGLRFLVNSPASVAGEKVYTYAKTGTGGWGGAVSTPINNVSIRMPVGDSLSLTSVSASSDMAGHIAFVYRGDNEFVCKARHASDAHAVALVIVNNIAGGPVGMGAGTTCTPPTDIPVFMISKEDGDAIDALYWAGDTAHFTITPWGLGLGIDLGFVPGGTAGWHNFAIPAAQLTGTHPAEYNMENTAFIANYGTSDLHNIKVAGTLSFTPSEGGATTVQHSDTANLSTFNAADSIYAMMGPSEYSLSGSSKGRYDIKYDIINAPDQIDQYPADNTFTQSFYVTDSLYSKGRYDFVKNAPVMTEYFSFGGGSDFLWGPTYYVKNGGAYLARIQYSLSNNATGALPGSVNLFLFKWNDGTNSLPKDSIMQDGELTMVSFGQHTFDGVNDTSGAILNFRGMGDPSSGNPMNIQLDDTSWYYLAVAVPGGDFLGSDGLLNAYPRIYGRFQRNNSVLDYSSVVATSTDEIAGNPNAANIPVPSASVAYVNSVDSFIYSNMKGLIPSVAIYTSPTPLAVHNVPQAPLADVVLFPNPAKDNISVTLNLPTQAKKVTYTIIDGLGRFVGKEVHENVQNEVYNMNTSKLASGHYFLVINFDEHGVVRNFVINK